MPGSAPLLATKLRPPPGRSALVARPRLLERFDEGMAAGLTLLSAPAGYGKTTLMTEWLHHLGRSPANLHAGQPASAFLTSSLVPGQVAWLSLDEGDNDPARFFAYLLAALQFIDPNIGRPAQAMLQTPQAPPVEALLTSLVNDLAAVAQPFVLILDDYHTIHTLPIHQQLAFLLEHRPDSMRLVIATREDPPLPLTRLRARGQVIEIRQADLRFTLDEGAEFLRRVMRIHLAQADVIALHQRTEGWIAGLQLAALSVQGQPDPGHVIAALAGSHRYVLDYLIEEVFQRQPAAIRDFLLRTSILERLCGELCDALTAAGEEADRAQGEAILNHLDRANLFVIPLDAERHWYRYHHLFAELLRHRARMALGEQAVALLHRRASAWFAAHSLLPEAVGHALAAQDWALAARLASAAAGALLRRGEITTLLGWFAALPGEMVQAQARLCLDYAWPLLLAGQAAAAAPLLSRAAELAPAEDPPPDGNLVAFQGQIAAARSFLARSQGDLPASAELAHVALALLPASDLLLRGVVGVNLGMAYWHNGRMAEAEPILQAALRAAQGSGNDYARLAAQVFLARVRAVAGELREAAAASQAIIAEGSPSPLTTLAFLDLTCLEYEWNNLTTAEEQLRQGTALAERSGHAEFCLAADLLWARLHTARGDLPAALAALRQAHDLALSHHLASPTLDRIAAAGVEAALSAGDLPMAERWAGGLNAETDPHPFYRFLGLTRPRLLIATRERRTAAAALQTAFETATRSGWGYGGLAARVLQALAAETTDAGLTFLAEALQRARPQRFIRTFADAGPALTPLLHEAARRGITPDYVGEILAAIRPQTRPAADLAEPLSPRELEVLRLLAAGLSNRAIAEQLILSPGTVKAHIHNLCGKLAASNRTEAAARARQLALLSS